MAVGFLPEGLSKKMNIYHPGESAVFCKTKERFGGLSNMAAGFPLLVCGVECRTSEALYYYNETWAEKPDGARGCGTSGGSRASLRVRRHRRRWEREAAMLRFLR